MPSPGHHDPGERPLATSAKDRESATTSGATKRGIQHAVYSAILSIARERGAVDAERAAGVRRRGGPPRWTAGSPGRSPRRAYCSIEPAKPDAAPYDAAQPRSRSSATSRRSDHRQGRQIDAADGRPGPPDRRSGGVFDPCNGRGLHGQSRGLDGRRGLRLPAFVDQDARSRLHLHPLRGSSSWSGSPPKHSTRRAHHEPLPTDALAPVLARSCVTLVVVEEMTLVADLVRTRPGGFTVVSDPREP